MHTSFLADLFQTKAMAAKPEKVVTATPEGPSFEMTFQAERPGHAGKKPDSLPSAQGVAAVTQTPGPSLEGTDDTTSAAKVTPGAVAISSDDLPSTGETESGTHLPILEQGSDRSPILDLAGVTVDSVENVTAAVQTEQPTQPDSGRDQPPVQPIDSIAPDVRVPSDWQAALGNAQNTTQSDTVDISTAQMAHSSNGDKPATNQIALLHPEQVTQDAEPAEMIQSQTKEPVIQNIIGQTLVDRTGQDGLVKIGETPTSAAARTLDPTLANLGESPTRQTNAEAGQKVPDATPDTAPPHRTASDPQKPADIPARALVSDVSKPQPGEVRSTHIPPLAENTTPKNGDPSAATQLHSPGLGKEISGEVLAGHIAKGGDGFAQSKGERAAVAVTSVSTQKPAEGATAPSSIDPRASNVPSKSVDGNTSLQAGKPQIEGSIPHHPTAPMPPSVAATPPSAPFAPPVNLAPSGIAQHLPPSQLPLLPALPPSTAVPASAAIPPQMVVTVSQGQPAVVSAVPAMPASTVHTGYPVQIITQPTASVAFSAPKPTAGITAPIAAPTYNPLAALQALMTNPAIQPLIKEEGLRRDSAEGTGFALTGQTSEAVLTNPTRQTAEAQIARTVAQQLIEMARIAPDRPVDVALNPEELGRVRMTLSGSETGMHVTLAIERPETQDLLRRNIELLANEFRELGYSEVSFSFSSDGADQDKAMASGHNSESSTRDDTLDPAPLTQIQKRVTLHGGVDLRL